MTFGAVGHLADEMVRLGLRLAETTCLLAVAVQYAWLDAWIRAHARAAEESWETADRRARTYRLIGRGVPPEAAAQDMRIV